MSTEQTKTYAYVAFVHGHEPMTFEAVDIKRDKEMVTAFVWDEEGMEVITFMTRETNLVAIVQRSDETPGDPACEPGTITGCGCIDANLGIGELAAVGS